MKTRQQAADGFYRHLREWFTAFLPRQRGAAENTITSCRQTWNMLLGYVAEHHHASVENVTLVRPGKSGGRYVCELVVSLPGSCAL